MSASNYAVCPRCLRRAREARAAELLKITESYGKVSPVEYLKAVSAVSEVSRDDYYTFAEYYEIYGAEDGTVTVDYGGSCTRCGLSLSFKDEHPVPGVGE